MSGGATAHYDVAVVGAGPGGAVAALKLARRGVSVLLVDRARFPRSKVCGCCVNRDALTTLDRLGLSGRIESATMNPLDALRLAAGRRCARVPIPAAAAVSRTVLDAALVDAARAAGATFHDGTAASWVASDERIHRLQLRAASETCEIHARAIVAADGVAGRLLDAHPAFTRYVARRSRIGLGAILDDVPEHYDAGAIHMACARHGYVGIVRLEDGTLDVAAAVSPCFVRRDGGPAAAVAAMLREVDWPEPAGLDAARWRGTSSLTHRRRPVACDGVFIVGDAAGYVEPFTGEGIAWALRSGEAVSGPVLRMLDSGDRPSAAAKWRAAYATSLAGPQRRCRAIAHVLRHPMLMRAIVAAAEHAPWIVRPMVEAVAAPGRCGAAAGRRSLASHVGRGVELKG